MKKIQKGFTLIELMIVVAIIGILAAVAIPAYQDYVVKAKLSKVQSTIDPIKLALAMYYQENGSFPVGTESAPEAAITAGSVWSSIGLTVPPVLPAEVSDLTVSGSGTNVTLELTLTGIKANTIDNLKLGILGEAGGTAITWTCYQSSGTAATKATTSAGMDPIALKYFGGDKNPNCKN